MASRLKASQGALHRESKLTPSQPWDAYEAYLFDIDGTLLTCHDAVHYEGFSHALMWLNEAPLILDGVTVHGNTDRGILRDAMLLTGRDAQPMVRNQPAPCRLASNSGYIATMSRRPDALKEECAQSRSHY